MIVLAKVELLYIGFPFSVFFGCVKVGKVFGSVCLAEGDIFRKNADSLRKSCFFRAFAGYRAFLRFQSFRHEVVPRVVAMAVSTVMTKCRIFCQSSFFIIVDN